MSGILDFKGTAAAESWKSKAYDLNMKTDEKLKQLSACLTEIKGESAGDMVDSLVEAGAQMLDSGARLTSAMNEICTLVNNIISKLAGVVVEALTGIDMQKSTMTMADHT